MKLLNTYKREESIALRIVTKDLDTCKDSVEPHKIYSFNLRSPKLYPITFSGDFIYRNIAVSGVWTRYNGID